MSKTRAMLKVEETIGEDIKYFLCRKYYSENLTPKDIGELVGYSTSTVSMWFRKLELPLRSMSDASKVRYLKTTEEERKAQTASANKRTREAIRDGEFWLKGGEFGEANVAKRPEVRKKISDFRKVNNPMFEEVHRMKMRRSMEAVLRNRATPQELLFNEALKKTGYEFKFQHAVCRAVLDFAFVDLKIGIELDGRHHVTNAKTLHKDIYRDDELDREGWILIRFLNSEIEDDIDGCIKEVLDIVDANYAIFTRKKAVI